MELTTLWWLLAILLILVGFAGNILPLLPGTPLMLIGMLLAAWLDDFNRIGAFSIGVLVVLAILSQLADFLAGTLGAQRAGASKQALWGATIGSLAGIFAGLPGMLLGPFVGAAIGELIAEQDLLKAGKVGLATWIGLVLGMAAKIAIGFTMLGVFVLAYFW
ncbi:MAG: uncharacterized protein QG660_54 [Pseudomonadota bacterium]|jgi:uncharacterized protein YqgC (DUF456 family)|nr:uncharacterized protein [Pseudomonadota bacterium]MDQ5916946.1 uncharacterized protein [Pseudomonadota bacterium]